MSLTTDHLLLVDDDPDLLRLLVIRLEAAGYKVVTASNGIEALARCAAARPRVVISDMRMPAMDGTALFDALRERDPSLPVIILTAHGSIPDAVAATQRGVFAYLTKPYEARDLLATIERAWQLSAGSPEQIDDPLGAGLRAFVTQNQHMRDLLSQARLVAAGAASVLLRGPSGSGKEVLARFIHQASPRARQPFVAVNCAAIPEALLESELFGHRRGAFTGALQDQPGLIRSADGGTLFLDEIGDMPAALQVKLLRVLEERSVCAVGATRAEKVDIRLISATHRDLDALMRTGGFRSDLYYRLDVVSLELSPLAQRRDDIPLLARHFLQQLSERYQKPVNAFAPEAMELLIRASWPGNVRQLLNVVEQAVALATAPVIPASLIQLALRDADEFVSFDEARRRFEADYLSRLLKLTAGNVTQAARLARRNRTDFYKLLQRHGLEPTLFK